MKKISVILIAICIMLGVFSVNAMAATSKEPVMHVLYGSMSKDFDDFEDGWNFAMEQANSGKEVHVTLLADWTAEEGQFTDDFFNGPGFDYDAIYFANDVTITLDLGRHTIDRGLTFYETNGEVMFINDGANVTIKNGTIKGGFSDNGAGGIHIENANVKLIDLVFTGNRVRNDDGAALQHVDGGELYMKNCRFVDNGSFKGLDNYGTVYLDSVDKVLIEDCYFADNDNIDYGGAIHADECNDFVIKNTTFENIQADDSGGAIWVGDSELYIYNCKFNNNSCGNYGGAIYASSASVYVYDSEFKGNYADWHGGAVYLTAGGMENDSIPSYFYRCTFDGNGAGEEGGAIYCSGGLSVLTKAITYGCEFINNSAGEDGGAVSMATDCGFEFYSDKETGRPGIIKNNSAGELGGGIYQGKNSPIDFGGEIYISENVSSVGADDFHVNYGGIYLDIQESITSPDGSIGIYYTDTDGGSLAEWIDESITVNTKAFFFNNAEFKLVLGEEYANTMAYQGKIYTIDLIPKTAAVGSIFGEGSLTMIVAILALASSAVSISLTVYYNKKKAAPATADEVAETEDEE